VTTVFCVSVLRSQARLHLPSDFFVQYDAGFSRFSFHFALVFLKETTNHFLPSLNQILRHILSKRPRGIYVLFSLVVPTADTLCVGSIGEDRETFVNQEFVVRFPPEAEAGAVIFLTTSSAEQLNM
jgi:hypothetical protein